MPKFTGFHTKEVDGKVKQQGGSDTDDGEDDMGENGAASGKTSSSRELRSLKLSIGGRMSQSS